MKNEKIKWENIIGFIFIIASLFMLAFVILQGMGEDIWYDEVFSMGMSERSFQDIIHITAKDVHPPLYYFYLKVIQDVSAVLFPFASKVVVAKMASILPVIGLFIVAFTSVRKRFSLLCSGLFLFLIMTMPQMSTYMLEIRMYSFAMLFITIAFLKACDIAEKEKMEYRDYVIFFVCGIATAYTQYYACIAIVALYLILFIYLLIKRREKKSLYSLLICVVLSIISYIPWLPVLTAQFHKVSEGYWIQPMTIRSLFGCIKFIYLPVSANAKMNYISAFIMIASTIVSMILFIKKKPDKNKLFMAIAGIMMLIFVILSGFLLSIIGRPVFVYRYMIPCLAVFWLVIACVLISSMDKKWSMILLIPFIIGAFFTTKGFYEEEHKKIGQMENTGEALSELPKEAVIVTNFDHVTAISSYYLKNDIYLYEGTADPLIPEMYPNCRQTCDEDMIYHFLKENKEVYFFGSFNARDELIAKWSERGITSEEINSCLLERYWFNIYKLGVNTSK